MNPKTTRAISIEGNIGVGKSLLGSYIRASYSDEFVFYEEPVDEYQHVFGEDLLSKYYTDPPRWGLTLQMWIIEVFLHRYEQQAMLNDGRIRIYERSLWTSKMFTKMLLDMKTLSDSEYGIYKALFNRLEKLAPVSISHIIYLRAEPLVALQRQRQRNRAGESIPMSYLEQLHAAHEKWLIDRIDLDEKTKVYTIDANQPSIPVFIDTQNALREIIKSFK